MDVAYPPNQPIPLHTINRAHHGGIFNRYLAAQLCLGQAILARHVRPPRAICTPADTLIASSPCLLVSPSPSLPLLNLLLQRRVLPHSILGPAGTPAEPCVGWK